MMNAEYDFADENENTNEKPADEQSTGDHEDSDGEGIQSPPPPTELKRLLEVWAKELSYIKQLRQKTYPESKHNDFVKQWTPRQPLFKLRVD